jgi:SAM-dependent methyltransferase
MSIVFDEKESRRVERIYLTPDIVEQRARVLEALTLQPGERAADLGCGPGLLALDMARHVGSAGEIQCIDASESMVALAARRLAAFPHVHVQAGDVAALPYADRSLDAAVCTQVYEYVPEVDHALAELHRVLKPSGRAVIVDSDWESCVWNSSDTARMRRVMESWDKHCAHPHLPATLARRLRAAGFDIRKIDVVALINDRYDPDTYSHGMIPALASWARKQYGEDEARAWSEDLRMLGERGDYFFSLNRYMFVARKAAL